MMCPECDGPIPEDRTIYCGAVCRNAFRRRLKLQRRVARRMAEGEAWVPVLPGSLAYGKSEWRRFRPRT